VVSFMICTHNLSEKSGSRVASFHYATVPATIVRGVLKYCCKSRYLTGCQVLLCTELLATLLVDTTNKVNTFVGHFISV
jgi:hypothetical protein